MEDAYYTYIELEENVFDTLFHMFLPIYEKGIKDKHVPWKVIPKNRIKQIWEDNVNLGFLRDVYHKNILEFQNTILENISKIQLANIVGGHETSADIEYFLDRIELAENHPEIASDEFIDSFSAWMDAEDGSWRISDYGLPQLKSLAIELIHATDMQEKLIIISRIFQVTHQRGDLSELFVEGGSSTCCEIFEA